MFDSTHTGFNDDADLDNNDNRNNRVDDDDHDAQFEMEQNENAMEDNDIDMMDDLTNDVQLHQHISFDLGFGTDDESG